MTHRFIGRILACGVIVASSWAILSGPASAQSVTPSSGGITPGSVDVTANAGWSNLTGIDGNKHINFSGAVGLNVSPNITVLGEYTFLPMGSESASSGGTTAAVKGKYQTLGGAVRCNLGNSRRFVPYAVFGMGYNRATAGLDVGVSGTGSATVSSSLGGFYTGFGGGASWFLGRNWGMRSELRWDRQYYSYQRSLLGQNAVIAGGGIFLQFGGHGKRRT